MSRVQTPGLWAGDRRRGAAYVRRTRGAGSSLLTGLVSYWALGEASGTRADSHGANDLTDNNSVGQAAGILGDAASFDGAGRWLSRATNASLEVSTGSAALWWKGATPGGSFRGLLVKLNAYSIFLNDGQFGLYDWGGGAFRASGVSPTDGGWHHLAITFESGVAGGLKLYADGAQAGGSLQMTVASQASDFAVGAGDAAGNQNVAGAIDAAGVWSRVITAGEVAWLYNSGSGREYPWAGGP